MEVLHGNVLRQEMTLSCLEMQKMPRVFVMHTETEILQKKKSVPVQAGFLNWSVSWHRIITSSMPDIIARHHRKSKHEAIQGLPEKAYQGFSPGRPFQRSLTVFTICCARALVIYGVIIKIPVSYWRVALCSFFSAYIFSSARLI